METTRPNSPMLVRFYHPEAGSRTAVQLDDTVYDVGDALPSITTWLQQSVGRVQQAIAELVQATAGASHSYPATLFSSAPFGDTPHWLPPVDEQDVWAAGVTYQRSRRARQEEAIDGGDIYARVYRAQRPELFFKARGPWVVGPYAQVGIRGDATWNVPEPELALVINPELEIVGTTVGNDMSSRDIEGANPLYLPQAKVYTAACALGPGIRLGKIEDTWPSTAIQMQIIRAGDVVFKGATHSDQIHRGPDELVGYLGRCLEFPDGAVLLTGTGIVPPDEFTLAAGDLVEITIEGIGALHNVVRVV